MNSYKDLETKICSMTAKEIILAMVEGLKNPVTEIDMNTFGKKNERGVCYGCAATNAICKIGNLDPNIELRGWLPKYSANGGIIAAFEGAIDSLRTGDVDDYNDLAKAYGFAIIEQGYMYLPVLTDGNFNDPFVLQHYIDLANFQNKFDSTKPIESIIDWAKSKQGDLNTIQLHVDDRKRRKDNG